MEFIGIGKGIFIREHWNLNTEIKEYLSEYDEKKIGPSY
jgi:hypothetical protein